MKRVCILLFLLSVIFASASPPAPIDTSQNRFRALDEYAKKVPKEHEKSITTLADYLIVPTKSELEKARVIYTWVATHLKYDATAFNNGYPGDQSTETVLKNKRGVCEGYSNLVKDLCEAVGLQAEKVIGYSKGYGYKQGKKFKHSDHAWNAVKIEGQWQLMDVTWGSSLGSEVSGKLKSKPRFDPYWFCVNPKEFIFTHMPEDQQWQLLDSTITLRTFEKLPEASDNFFKLGFNPDQVFHDATEGRLKDLATCYDIPYSVKAIQLPYTKDISKSESTQFVLESEQATEMVMIDGKSVQRFEKNGNIFSLSYTPGRKKVYIAVTEKTAKGKNFQVVMQYRVRK